MDKTKWVLDPAHSELGFKIRHLMINNVSGYFKGFQVEAETTADDFSNASILLTTKIADLSTNDEKRDAHLRSADFFDADNFPFLTFKSTQIEQVESERFVLSGELTLKGKTNPVSLNVEFGGIAKDAHGNDKAGFAVTGTIKRSDWGYRWSGIGRRS